LLALKSNLSDSRNCYQIGTTARQIYRVAFIIDYEYVSTAVLSAFKVTIELELQLRQTKRALSIEFLLITGLISNSSTKIDIQKPKQNQFRFVFWPSNIEKMTTRQLPIMKITNKTAFVVIFII
jgi:hypothetical protein